MNDCDHIYPAQGFVCMRCGHNGEGYTQWLVDHPPMTQLQYTCTCGTHIDLSWLPATETSIEVVNQWMIMHNKCADRLSIEIIIIEMQRIIDGQHRFFPIS